MRGTDEHPCRWCGISPDDMREPAFRSPRLCERCARHEDAHGPRVLDDSEQVPGDH